MLLKILQYSQENTCIGVSLLIKLQALGEIFKAKIFGEHLQTTLLILSKRNSCEVVL